MIQSILHIVCTLNVTDFLLLGNQTGVSRLVNPMSLQSFQVFDLRAFSQVGFEKIKYFLTAYLFSQKHSHIIYIHKVHCKPLPWTACIWKDVLHIPHGLISKSSVNTQRTIWSVKQFNGTTQNRSCAKNQTVITEFYSNPAPPLNYLESPLSQFIYLGQHIAVSPLQYFALKYISIRISRIHFHLSFT